MGRDRFSLPSTIREPKKKYDQTRRGHKNLINFFDKKIAPTGKKVGKMKKIKTHGLPLAVAAKRIHRSAKPRLTRKLRFLEMETKNGQRAIGEESQKNSFS